MKKLNNNGFTLVEMLIAMVLVVVVIVVTGSAFESIIKNTSKLTSSEESNIEGVVALEMFRHDLQQAGFGLPHAYLSASLVPLTSELPTYAEADAAPASLLNDSGTLTRVPRAIVSLNNVTGLADSSDSTVTYNILDGTDYLAIKATTVGRSKTSQKWTYVSYSSGGRPPNSWPNQSDNLTSGSSRVIMLDRYPSSETFNNYSSTGAVTNVMKYDKLTPNIYWVTHSNSGFVSAFSPSEQGSIYYIYGVDDSDLRMPFNRADYFVARPSNSSKVPATCAKNTGILYKTTVNHANGLLTYMPLLDCVADMQLVFGWDMLGNGVIDESSAYSSSGISVSNISGLATSSAISKIMMDPAQIREKLKYIKVYIMAQDGRKDPGYTNRDLLINNTKAVVVGEPGPNPPSNVNLTKAYSASELQAKDTATNGWLNYRWKIYKIVVRPKNIIMK